MATPNSCVERIEPHVVNELRRAIYVPDGEITVLANFERADALALPKRACSGPRDAHNAFLHCHAKQCGSHTHHQQNGGEQRGAGVAVCS